MKLSYTTLSILATVIAFLVGLIVNGSPAAFVGAATVGVIAATGYLIKIAVTQIEAQRK